MTEEVAALRLSAMRRLSVLDQVLRSQAWHGRWRRLRPVARPMADRARLAGLRKDGTTIPVTITLSPVLTASGHFVLAVVRDATQEHWQDDLTDLVRAVMAEQAQHAEDMLDRVVGGLLHVGLSLDTAAGQPAELARERISSALQRLDDTVHEIRDHVFRSRRPGDSAW
jgi:hypothetical protein